MGKSGQEGKAKDHRGGGGALQGDQMKEALARASIEIPASQEDSNREASESNPNQEIPEKVKMAADLAIAHIREMASDILNLNDPSLGEAEKKILTETQQEIDAIRDQAITEIEAALNEAGITKEKIQTIQKIKSTAKSGEIKAATAPDSTDAKAVERPPQGGGAEIAEKPVEEASENQTPPEGKQEGPEITLEQAQEQAIKLVDERRTLFKSLKESGLLEKNPQLNELFEQSRETCKDYNESFGEGKRPTLEQNQEIIKYLSELLQKIKTLVSEIESNASGDAKTKSGETKESELNASQKTARLFSEIKDYVSKWEVGKETSFQTEKDKKRGVAKIENFGSQLTELLNKEDELSFEDRGKLIEAMALLSGKFGQSQELKNRYYENGVFNDTEYRSDVFDDTKQQMEDAEAAFMAVAEKMFPEAKAPKDNREALALIRRLKSNEFKINEDLQQATYDRLTEILDDKEKLKQELHLEIANVGNKLYDFITSEVIVGGRDLSKNTKANNDDVKKIIRDERYIYQLRLILDALDVEGQAPQKKEVAVDTEKQGDATPAKAAETETGSEDGAVEQNQGAEPEQGRRESYEEKKSRLNNLIKTCRTALKNSTLTDQRKIILAGMIDGIAEKVRKQKNYLSGKELNAYIKDLEEYKIIIERGDTTPDNLPIVKNKPEGEKLTEGEVLNIKEYEDILRQAKENRESTTTSEAPSQEQTTNSPEQPNDETNGRAFGEELPEAIRESIAENEATALQERKVRQEKADRYEFTHHQGILEGFFLTRFIGRKLELLGERAKRTLGEKEANGGGYDIVHRGIVKLANLFDKKFFEVRNAKSEKIESKIAAIDGQIELLNGEVEDSEAILNDQELPYKQRSKAQTRMVAAKKKIRQLEQKKDGYYESLHLVEQKKKECHDRISERCQGVSEAIKERIEPHQNKLEDGKKVLEKINQEISEGEAQKKEWENKLLELEGKYANAPRSQRSAIKQALRDAKRAIKRADGIIAESNKRAEICRDKLSHLRDKINPWENLQAAYEDAGQLPTTRENESLKEYERTAFATTQPSWEMAPSEKEITPDDYIKKFNFWLKVGSYKPQEILTVERLREALGDNKKPTVGEIEDALVRIYGGQMNQRRLEGLIRDVRIDIQ
ncbi:MAG: hypothetical protein BWY53_00131 [Parcubacteria group bacterium ADurb.Bin326]|nr:MAG: hypothetical protein BWY53_00131 [Parcubacteria group bacterium ADurb.Bin326]